MTDLNRLFLYNDDDPFFDGNGNVFYVKTSVEFFCFSIKLNFIVTTLNLLSSSYHSYRAFI